MTTEKEAFKAFVEDLRGLYARKLPEQEHWQSAADILKQLIANQDLRQSSEGWPVSKGQELVLYHDTEHKFFVGGLVREAEHTAKVHDHAHTWTIYGELCGGETTNIYERLDDGSVPGRAELKLSASKRTDPGEVDIVPPFVIHQECNAGGRAVAITIRSERPGTYTQKVFDLEAGTFTDSHKGQQQIEYPLL